MGKKTCLLHFQFPEKLIKSLLKFQLKAWINKKRGSQEQVCMSNRDIKDKNKILIEIIKQNNY